jgi:hypothetical protein
LKTKTLEHLITFGLGLGEGDRTLLNNHVTKKAEGFIKLLKRDNSE